MTATGALTKDARALRGKVLVLGRSPAVDKGLSGGYVPLIEGSKNYKICIFPGNQDDMLGLPQSFARQTT